MSVANEHSCNKMLMHPEVGIAKPFKNHTSMLFQDAKCVGQAPVYVVKFFLGNVIWIELNEKICIWIQCTFRFSLLVVDIIYFILTYL